MAPLPKKVEKAGIKGVKRKRKPYQVSAEDFFSDANTIRGLYSELIDNPEPDRIAILPSVSYGIGNITKNLAGKKGEILLVEDQFPSNYYPWKALESDDLKIKTVKKPTGVTKGGQWNQAVLEEISTTTLAVAIGNVHWADGTLFDLQAIRRKTTETGSLLVIDGTQSVGALPISIADLKPDALICASYKWLFGPYGIALGYYGPALDGGSPLEENWINRKGSENFGGLINYQPEYHPQALRYEVGEHSNFVLLPMVIAALKLLRRWGVTSIQEYCTSLTDQLVNEINALGYGVEERGARSGHLVGLTLPENVEMDKLQKLLKARKISLSTRGTSLRVSPNVYNDERDVDRLIKTLKEVVK